MAVRGDMFLYNWDGCLLKWRGYRSVEDRKKTLKYWEKLEGKKFSDMYIHIFPETRVDAIRKNGENYKNYSKRAMFDTDKPIFKRPPAVYDNIKHYEYE